MRFPVIFFLSFFSASAFGQNVSFFQNGTKWIYNGRTEYYPGEGTNSNTTYQYEIVGDYLLDGKTYKTVSSKIMTITGEYVSQPVGHYISDTFISCNIPPLFLRYDSVTQHVYYRGSTDNFETLIYDFTQVQGDTIPLKPQGNHLSSLFVIDTIITIQVEGISLRKFLLTDPEHPIDNYEDNYLIEGIGSASGLFWHNPNFLDVSGGYYKSELKCFALDAFILGFSADFNGRDTIFTTTSCEDLDCTVGTKEEGVYPEINLSPNPANDILNIEIKSSNHFQISTLSLADTYGNILYENNSQTTIATTKLNLSQYSKGIYLLQITLSDGRRVIRKVVLQ